MEKSNILIILKLALLGLETSVSAVQYINMIQFEHPTSLILKLTYIFYSLKHGNNLIKSVTLHLTLSRGGVHKFIHKINKS